MIKLRLLLLSDIHGNLFNIKDIYKKVSRDISCLVICGDITHFGNLIQTERIIKELSKPSIPTLFVPGNCDPKKLATTHVVHHAINIHGKYKEIQGLGFLGIGGSSPTPFHTPFELSENDIKSILDETYNNNNIQRRLILVSHAPPANTRVDLTSFGVHAGSLAVKEFIEKVKPLLVLCGHIHESKGVDLLKDTLIVNPGPAYKGFYAKVDVKENIKVELGESI